MDGCPQAGPRLTVEECREGHEERTRPCKAGPGICGSYGGSVTDPRPLISVVDDDASVRESLPDLLNELGFDVRAFSSAGEFLASDVVDRTDCLLLDVAMAGMTGPDLQSELILRGHKVPVVFITARSDEAVRTRVLDNGAVAYLLKPFSDTALLDAIRAALRSSSGDPSI